MNCWRILGIGQTSDLAAIKAAYAAKAKEWHPEEHPEAFQQLQQAYRSAVRYAKAHKGHAGSPVVAKSAADTMQGAFIDREILVAGTAKKEIAYTKEEIGEKKETEKCGELGQDCDNNEPESGYRYDDSGQIYGYEEREHENSEQGDNDSETQQVFDYEVVGETDLNDQFFREFFDIARNPYLMNNLVCWEYILNRSPYDRLLRKGSFRENFVRTAAGLSGWKRRTILFFEKWLQSVAVEDEGGGHGHIHKKETELLCWKIKKISLFEEFISAQRCVTNDQKRIHDIFLAQVGRCGRNRNLISVDDIACYLSFYLPYAAANQSALKKMYQDNGQGRAIIGSVLFMAPLFVFMMIYVNVCVLPKQKEADVQENWQQEIQQQTDEVKKYNEWLRQKEGSSLEWTPEYREELMQEAIRRQEELQKEYERIWESEEPSESGAEIEEGEKNESIPDLMPYKKSRRTDNTE